MVLSTKDKILTRQKRKRRIRKKVFGVPDKPRLCVYKSNRYIYAQLIDDLRGVTIASASSLKYNKEKSTASCKRVDIAKKVGEELGKAAANKDIKRLVFDRSGYPYHGKVKALAEGVREQGIKF